VPGKPLLRPTLLVLTCSAQLSSGSGIRERRTSQQPGDQRTTAPTAPRTSARNKRRARDGCNNQDGRPAPKLVPGQPDWRGRMLDTEDHLPIPGHSSSFVIFLQVASPGYVIRGSAK